MHEPALLSAPLLSRRRPPGALRLRAGALGLAALAWTASIAALLLAQLLVAETLTPPRAVTGTIVLRQPPRPGLPSIKGNNGGARQASSPQPQPPQPRPTVLVQPPPSVAEPEENLAPENAGAMSDSAGGSGTGDGPPGSPTGCAGCPPSGEGGDGGPGGPLEGLDRQVGENHPDLERPVIIPSTKAVPEYPALARRAHVMGSVELLIVIDAEGGVGQIEVMRSPDPRYGFDLSAIEAVKQWRYRPGRIAGRTVAVQALVLIEFTLAR